jgi:hypothetical protein
MAIGAVDLTWEIGGKGSVGQAHIDAADEALAYVRAVALAGLSREEIEEDLSEQIDRSLWRDFLLTEGAPLLGCGRQFTLELTPS